jgi:membrane protein CcdC involved in cytochrome C biogenesis
MKKIILYPKYFQTILLKYNFSIYNVIKLDVIQIEQGIISSVILIYISCT